LPARSVGVVIGRQCGLDAPPSHVVLTVDARGLDLQQDVNAVPGPFGDLGGRCSGVEPPRHGAHLAAVRRVNALDHE
jgi:hypothetical protein